MKLDKNTKILLLIAGSLAVVYYFKDSLLSIFTPKEKESLGGETTPYEPGQVDTPKPKETYLDDVIKLGSKGEAVKRGQMRMNMIIDYVKNHHQPTWDFQMLTPDQQKTTIERSEKIASWKPLSVDGNAGTKTMELVKYLTTKSSTTLKILRDKYEAWENLVR